MKKCMLALLMAVMLLVGLLGCTGQKEAEDFGMKNCGECGKEYHATGENTLINEDGELIFVCPECR